MRGTRSRVGKVSGLQTKNNTALRAAMSGVGLDYLTLGQPLGTLSGGECQRIKLASELHKQGSIDELNEPTACRIPVTGWRS